MFSGKREALDQQRISQHLQSSLQVSTQRGEGHFGAGTPPTAEQEARLLEDPVRQASQGMLSDAAGPPHGPACGTFMHALQGRFMQMACHQPSRLLRAPCLQRIRRAVTRVGGVQHPVLAPPQRLAGRAT